MTEREFLEAVERELLAAAERRRHEMFSSRNASGEMVSRHIPDTSACSRCRIEDLADEAADRATRLAP